MSATGTITNQPVDVVAAQTLSGTVVAKDALTLVVGGLIEEEITDKRAQVPGLGEVPVLGIFFRRQDTGRSRKELLILIQPHVLSTPTESEAAGRRMLGDLSIHPMSPGAEGTLKTYDAKEVPTANPPQEPRGPHVPVPQRQAGRLLTLSDKERTVVIGRRGLSTAMLLALGLLAGCAAENTAGRKPPLPPAGPLHVEAQHRATIEQATALLDSGQPDAAILILAALREDPDASVAGRAAAVMGVIYSYSEARRIREWTC